ncbi:MAG: DUF58 domain-containing protein [Thermoguttaceae bacterium]
MPQDIVEIIRRVERVQILASRMVDELFAGQYKSVFRGRGMDFESIREYQPGDDIRAIEWNVTARSNSAFVKEFREERELIVLFLVDISASGAFGSARRSKLDAVIEMAALLMFSALRNNDRVGMLTFCDRVLDYSPPRKGKGNVLRLIRQLVALEPVASPTNLEAPLEFISGVAKRTTVLFLVSDFLAPAAQRGDRRAGVSVASAKLSSPFGGDVRRAMAVCKKRHDLIAVSISDPREHQLPDVGILSLRDAETGEIVKFDARSAKVRELFAGYAARRYNELARQLSKIGIDQLAIRTDESCVSSLRRFFQMRQRRFR